ncbi:MAG TPA: hypothetical protein VHW60_06640 [Caulobacteraceae bacterium]|jgi:hypothetical protein|nr:hypothetical protein [Caulobacteraceae bacterium]
MRLRLGVFATARGWVVGDAKQQQTFDDRSEAMNAARRQAQVARWRGDEAEIVAQDLPGGPLAVVDPPRRPSWRD